MGFLSLIIALLLEQARPLAGNNLAFRGVRACARTLEENFNAGEHQQGVLAWVLLTVPMTLAAALIYIFLQRYNMLLVALAFNILVLYFTLGFRHFSHYYTDIQLALANNDLPTARELLKQWKRNAQPDFSAAELGTTEIARMAIEEALLASHRHVFGVFFWFVLLPGPAGAVLYRLSDYLARAWNYPESPSAEPFGRFARRAFEIIDWLPMRLTAIGFAIVGNFEDAIFGWRECASRWNDKVRGILLAAGGGALGVRLGEAMWMDPAAGAAGEPMPGVEASPAALRSAVGLVWRSLVLWLILLVLLSVAGTIG